MRLKRYAAGSRLIMELGFGPGDRVQEDQVKRPLGQGGRSPEPVEPLLRLFDRSLRFRIGVALAIAYGAILVVHGVELHSNGLPICLPEEGIVACLGRQMLAIVAVGNVESFSILAAGVLYLLEARERRQQSDYEAWQAIERATAAGLTTSYSRFKALQDLNRRGVPLAGIALARADLRGIDLTRAGLRQADLVETDLGGADLREADLSGARLHLTQFVGARLSGANLSKAVAIGSDWSAVEALGGNFSGIDCSGCRGIEGRWTRANLSHANFQKAILLNAHLDDANLSHGQFEGAQLSGADFRDSNLSWANLQRSLLDHADLRDCNLSGASLMGANLQGAQLDRANLGGADLRSVQGLAIAQVQLARNWEEALFDEAIAAALGPGDRPNPEGEDARGDRGANEEN